VTTNLPKPLVIGFRRPLEANQDPFLGSVGIAVIPIPPAGESYSSVQILEYYTEKDITDLRDKFSDFELYAAIRGQLRRVCAFGSKKEAKRALIMMSTISLLKLQAEKEMIINK
jgi:hypothetical protein